MTNKTASRPTALDGIPILLDGYDFFFFFFLRRGNLRKTPGDTEGCPRIVPDFYRLKPLRWPTASLYFCTWEHPFRASAPDLPSFTRLWVLAHSLRFSLCDPSSWDHARRRPSSVDSCRSAQALTRALLSLRFRV